LEAIKSILIINCINSICYIITDSPPNNLYQALVMYKSDYKKFVMNFVVIQANKYSEVCNIIDCY
jgi:hypothetical protein